MNRLSRRSLLGGVGATVGSIGGCLSLLERSGFDPADWPQGQADAGQTKYSPTPGPVEDAEVAWRQSLENPDHGFYASVFLVDGTVYVGSNEVRRSYFAPGIHVGSVDSLYAVDSTSGEIAFRVPDVNAVYGLAGTRTYSDGVVLSDRRARVGDPQRSHDRTIGLNPSGGIAPERWNVRRAPPSGWSGARPGETTAIADGTWFYCSLYDPGTIVAVDVDDGRERWTRRIDIDGSPILLADTDRLVLVDAWFPEQSTLHVLDHDGNVLGQAEGPSSPRVTLRDGSITLVAAADQFVVETYDADTLERTWRNAIEIDHDARVQLATSPEYVVATADSEQPVPTRLFGFDRHNGDQRWQTAVSGTDHPRTIALSLAIGDDTVYVGNNDGSVFAFALADGTERWRIESAEELGEYEPLGRTVEPIVVGDGRLYLWDGQELLALEEP